MTITGWLKALQELEEKHLPFEVKDVEAVNEVFGRWQRTRADSDLQVIEVWLYIYVHHDVLFRLLRDPNVAAGDVDRIISYVFVRLRTQLKRVDDPARFFNWVCVSSKNSFLNGLRHRFNRVPLNEATLPAPDAEAEALNELDRTFVRNLIRRAIRRLPAFQQPVAEMRFLGGHSYKYIAAATQHPLPTVRTYASGALAQLRRDPDLHDLARTSGFFKASELDKRARGGGSKAGTTSA